ncbi:MAG TPA: NADH-quinone oxidoreductase subunit K [Longimicrobiales bacterium]|nr:NADH-quinone oxidoreductase subunit K [Longimicrobiales bacterium]
MNGILFQLLGAALAGAGFGAFVGRRHLLWRIIGVNVLGSGVFLLLLTVPAGVGGTADAVPQAMVLTGIVVTVAATALALALAVRLAATGAPVDDDTGAEEPPAGVTPAREPSAGRSPHTEIGGDPT